MPSIRRSYADGGYRILLKRGAIAVDEPRFLKRVKQEPVAEFCDDSMSSKDGDRVSPISVLHFELLVDIVKLVPKAQWASLEGVNRTFRMAAFEAWRSQRKLRLDEDLVLNRELSENDPMRVLDTLLKKLSIRSPKIADMSGFWVVGDIPSCISKRVQFFRLLTRFEHLERISFADLQVDIGEVLGFLTRSASRGHLKELDISRLTSYLSESSQVRGTLLEAANRPALALEKIWCDKATFNRFTIFNGSRLTSMSFSETSVHNADLLRVLNQCHQLSHLSIMVDCHHLHEDRVLAIQSNRELFRNLAAATSRNLTSLKLASRYWCITNSFYPIVIDFIKECGTHRRITELSLVHFAYLTDTLIDAIGQYLPGLTRLELSIGEPCTTDALINMLTTVPKLEKLLLQTDGIKKFEVELIAAIGKNSKKLEQLHLFGDFVNANKLEDLVDLTNLKELCFSRGVVSTSVVFEAWAKGFGSNLISLDLQHMALCPDSIAGLLALIRKSPRLQRLNLGSTSLTDSQLKVVAASCPLLREFSICQCSKVTAKGFQLLIDRCQLLKWLFVRGRSLEWYSNLKPGKYRKVNIGMKGRKKPYGGND